MDIIPYLIVVPFVCGLVNFAVRKPKIRRYTTYLGCAVIMALALVFFFSWVSQGAADTHLYVDTHVADLVMLAGEVLLSLIVVIQCFRYRKYWILLLSVIPTAMMVYLERFGPVHGESAHIRVDHLSVLMCLIVGIVGVLIVFYSRGYMTGYHKYHHTELPDRRSYFVMLLFMFLGAMFGLVLSDNLSWILFFWECTSICSFLLIGYTGDEEAVRNSFRALWMNLFGGFLFVIGIWCFAYNGQSLSLTKLIASGAAGEAASVLPVLFLALASLTKSAQLPFSPWLIGAMVAPTPSSALLHSATMVKAGVYLLFRLSPALYATTTGNMIVFIGAFTFLVTALIAIAQSDGKRVLAFSTISNLGLMVACAGMGTAETVWAGVFLMIFHAVSKSLLFQAVGATENVLHSRNVEDMHGLLYLLPRLAVFLFIGIAGMFLAPFGMLIAKWSAFRASVDTGNVLMVLFIAFGSALTSFYWTKWMGKLISRSHKGLKVHEDITRRNENISMGIHAVLMMLLCLLFPLISTVYVNPMVTEMFGSASDVLPRSILYLLIVIVFVVFAVPFLSYEYVRHHAENIKLSYMNGINTGDNRTFVDAFGEPKTLWLSNYYFYHRIGQRRLMVPVQLTAMAVLIVTVIRILGGFLV